MTRRLIAVLGYSNGGGTLHEVCAARLRRAETAARPGDVVLLSGWSRRRAGRSEAELMAEAWQGPPVDLVVAVDARTTYGNAAAAVTAAISAGADEVVLVTSAWHAPRAAALFRAALLGRGIRLGIAVAEGPRNRQAHLRELACWLVAPAQTRLLHRRSVRA